MATATKSLAGVRSRKPAASRETRFDRRLAHILSHATDVFYEKGYEGASMRDLSRATRMSLSGLYYYFESKERLLYQIQKHTFSTIMSRLKQKLEGVWDPEQQIRTFILNHLEYFLSNQKAMTVLSHEDDTLKNSYGAEIAALKREYYRICVGLFDNLQKDWGVEFSSRTAVLSLFGMMNWIYTWYKPRVDGDARQLAQQMGDFLLLGLAGASGERKRK